MRKMGISGGTFDPVHWGHLLIAESALCQGDLEQVIWVPNPQPHYKLAALFEHRLEMVQRAIADHPAFSISPVAANPSTPYYAIQTLIDLQTIYPNTDWYWILGLDAFQNLPRWYRRQELAAACEWLVAPRWGDGGESFFSCEQVARQLADEGISIDWQILQMPILGISASLIRQYCHNCRSIRYLVPEPVRIYISTQNLYCE